MDIGAAGADFLIAGDKDLLDIKDRPLKAAYLFFLLPGKIPSSFSPSNE